MSFSAHAYTSIKIYIIQTKLYTLGPYKPNLQDYSQSTCQSKVFQGLAAMAHHREKSGPLCSGVRHPLWGLSSYCPARIIPIPRTSIFPSPGLCPAVPWAWGAFSQPGETFCLLYPSSTPSIPCSCPRQQLSPSPHNSLRKQHLPCLLRK